MIDRDRVAANVRLIRHQANLSQEALAHKAQLTRPYISGIERGKRNPSVNVLERIAKALQVPSAALLEGDYQRPPRKTPSTFKRRRSKVSIDLVASIRIAPVLRACPFIGEADLDEIASMVSNLRTRRLIPIENTHETNPQAVLETLNFPFQGAFMALLDSEVTEYPNTFIKAEEDIARLLTTLGYRTNLDDLKDCELEYSIANLPDISIYLVEDMKTVLESIPDELSCDRWMPSECKTEEDRRKYLSRTKLMSQIQLAIKTKSDRITIYQDIPNVIGNLYLTFMLLRMINLSPESVAHTRSLGSLFHEKLLNDLMLAFVFIYGKTPVFNDASRSPRGITTLWAKRLLKVAATNFSRYCEELPLLDVDAGTRKSIQDICDLLVAAEAWSLSYTAKRLREAWKPVRANWSFGG